MRVKHSCGTIMSMIRYSAYDRDTKKSRFAPCEGYLWCPECAVPVSIKVEVKQ